MPQENIIFYNQQDDLDEELNINFKKIWKTVCSRKELLIKVFCSVLAFFILLTFILPKKYMVTADLYINKTNNSNMLDINPFTIDDASGPIVSMGTDKAINNEIQLMLSELVLDKVIMDNDIKYKKGKKKGEYISADAFYKKGKYLKIENIKNTNVITIKYKANKPDFAYGVVSSLIANYVELHKEINTEKSKSDKQLLEEEYEKAKKNLDIKIDQASGLPSHTMSNIGNLSAMSAFSKSASHAINSLKSQYLEGQRSQIAVSEESQKLAHIATKLEWAKMVEYLSDDSKVLVLKEPKQLQPYENSSPKLLINIILGCIFGIIVSFIVLIYKEITDDKLTYSSLSNNIIYDGTTNLDLIKAEILGCCPKTTLLVSLTQLSQEFINNIQTLPNTKFIYADLNTEFIEEINSHDGIMLISKVQDTSNDSYKKIVNIIKKHNKTIIDDILV